MRSTTILALLATLAAFSIPACSNTSSTAAGVDSSSSTSTAAADSPMSDASGAASAVSTDGDSTAPANGAAPPVYPGAVESKRPDGVADSASPIAKAYTTTDDFAKVRAWYRNALTDANEMGDTATEASFLMPGGKSGMVVTVQASGGKTWIVIGPGFPQ